jgi:cysteine desulfurase
MGVLKEAKKHISGIPHMVVSSIEHSSVLTLAKVLAEEGVDVDFCRVGQDGIVDLDELASLLRDETILVSVMYVNNEIGTIEPIGEVARIIKEYKQKKGGISAYPLLHTDAAQAPLYLEVDVGKLGADLLTIDAQKIYGPKGAGALYIRKGVRLEPIFFGGGQEKGIRPSTQNVAGIVGLAEALRIAGEKRGKEVIRLRELQQYFFERIKNEIPQAIINGSTDQERRVPNNVNISIPGVEGDYLAVALDSRGVATSSASACSSSEASASHVVRAISEGDDRAESAIRFTMGRETKKEDINIAVEALKKSLSSFGIK